MSSTSYDTGCRPRNETEPLLDSNTANDGEIAGPDNIYWRPIVVITLMLLFSSFATILSQAPFLRVLEDIQCRRYYGEHPPKELNLRDGTIPEEFCKIPQVQELLAEILGIQALLTGIVGLLFAIPYVVAADKVGRRPVLILNIFAQLAAVSWMFLVCKYWRCQSPCHSLY
jgi:hypothetical protein